VIIGTAGHIDHGKTTLVRALTGVDTDRLPEERKRGISIELGYAFMDLPDGERLGFIDVPGHERLVHTMLAGATGMDHALLLVAADDGVMPQTREHLAVLALLNVAGITAVITKLSRASPERVAQVRLQVQALLAEAGVAPTACLEVDALSGTGLEALRAHLLGLPRCGDSAHDAAQGFRLSVDRVFSLDGTGTVCTGTVQAGVVALGDELALMPPPAGQSSRRARVRSLHAQNQAVPQARIGQRCALALAGVDQHEVRRGQSWVAPELAFSSARWDARLRLWPAEAKGLRSGTAVHVHVGAASCMASVAVLGREAEPLDVLAPGEQAWVQLVLHQAMAGFAGDAVVLRDASASRTLAGGVLLDPMAPPRYRRSAARLGALAALDLPDAPARLQALLAASPLGLNLSAWMQAQGLGLYARPALADGLGGLLRTGHCDAMPDADDALWAIADMHAQACRELALQRLAEHHRQYPDETGPDLARLRRATAPRLAAPLWQALVALWREQGWLQAQGAWVRLPAHGVQLSKVDQRVAQKIAVPLQAAGFEGAWVRDLARDAREPETLMRTALARLAQQGEVFQVVRDLFYSQATMAALAKRVREVALTGEAAGDATGEVKAAQFRDATGLGRKRAIQVLEYFDRAGLLRRVGERHQLRAESRLFVDGEGA